MKTFIIHYSPLTLRKQHMLSEIEKHKLDAVFIETEVGPGWYNSIPKGSISVFKKHIEAWRRIAIGSDPFGLILEDDAILDDDFLNKLNNYISQLPPDFDMLFVGNGWNLHLNIPSGTVGKYKRTRCVDSYIITKTCAAKLLRQVRIGIISRAVDWWINDLVPLFDLQLYWAEPTIVSQGSETGLFKSWNV
jgi:GR25 family glycosyltransferase involved in LPS biosynthesis